MKSIYVFYNLWIPHDQCILTILYAKRLGIYDHKTVLIKGEFYSYEQFKIIVKPYILRDFIKDPKFI